MCAPRENPVKEIAVNELPPIKTTIWTRLTEQTNSVANVIILHEESVTIYHVLIEVPSDSLIQDLRSPLKDRPNNTPCEIGSYSRLQINKSVLEGAERGTHLVIAQLFLDLVFSQKRKQLRHVCRKVPVFIRRAIKT